VDRNDSLTCAFEDAMAPDETRWTFRLGFTHQRSAFDAILVHQRY
jgi:hypothetical protein